MFIKYPPKNSAGVGAENYTLYCDHLIENDRKQC